MSSVLFVCIIINVAAAATLFRRTTAGTHVHLFQFNVISKQTDSSFGSSTHGLLKSCVVCVHETVVHTNGASLQTAAKIRAIGLCAC